MLAADFGHIDIVKLLCSGSGASGDEGGLKEEVWPTSSIAPNRNTVTVTEDEEREEGSEEAIAPQRCDVAAALQIARAKGMRDAEMLLLSYLQ